MVAFLLLIVFNDNKTYQFSEILRVIDSMQLTDKNKVATPENWKVSDSSATTFSYFSSPSERFYDILALCTLSER